ncbi:hypothetical protein LF1_15760 [Rubripirellula obstinata]|uniref:Lipopolysaccharide assembly protein A domain-containing protein n=1 Tax=Rubripirellula obstinata TaxID=406547 RepID=A0A5B1CHL1_9BACT|nr:LapA family protein [Rubripirellula obstinata]KAA1259050.1 hypothetical protein LF1_15760 [Rubripirellula obstinata]
MQKIRWFFLILAIVLMIAMAVQNNGMQVIRLFTFETREMPLSVLLLATTGIGFLMGALVTVSMLRSRRKKEKERERQAKAASNEEASPKPEPAMEDDAASKLGEQ